LFWPESAALVRGAGTPPRDPPAPDSSRSYFDPGFVLAATAFHPMVPPLHRRERSRESTSL